MPTLYAAEFLQGAAACMAAARLLTLGLARRQTALFAFLASNAVFLLVLASIPLESRLYFYVFIAYTFLNWAFSVGAVRETFSLSMSRWPGIRTAARWSLYAAVAVSLALSSVLSFAVWGAGRNGRSHYFYVQAADRSFIFTLAIILAALIYFLMRYPLELGRNTYVSCIFFSAVLLCQATGDLIDSLATDLFSRNADVVQVLASGAIFIGWAVFLRVEKAAETTRIVLKTSDDLLLLEQLEVMNRLLGGLGRR